MLVFGFRAARSTIDGVSARWSSEMGAAERDSILKPGGKLDPLQIPAEKRVLLRNDGPLEGCGGERPPCVRVVPLCFTERSTVNSNAALARWPRSVESSNIHNPPCRLPARCETSALSVDVAPRSAPVSGLLINSHTWRVCYGS